MRTNKHLLLVTILFLFPLTAAAAKKTSILDDGKNAKILKVEKMHGTRYMEMFLTLKDPETNKVISQCYNPMFTGKKIPSNHNLAPENKVDTLDFKKVKQKYNLINVSMNGPKNLDSRLV